MPLTKNLVTRLTAIVAVVALPWAGKLAAAEPPQYTLRLLLNGQKLEGRPLRWSAESVDLLGRDGRLYSFAPAAAKSPERVSDRFKGYSYSDVREQLGRELGNGFEITGTGHYVVACPRGKAAVWSQPFEDLYRSFVQFFAVRGISINQPQFPLVAIVFPNQQAFMQGAAREGINLPGSGVLGFYSPTTNRILLFDTGTAAAEQGIKVADTIIHEATHQTAFNTGVHIRFGSTPRWVAEGLGTLFEAPGVWNSRRYPQLQDRINQGRAADFRQLIALGRPSGAIVDLIGEDRRFQVNPGAAYAEAWALTFYLMETQPAKYSALLERINQRPMFGTYTQAERLKDFTAVFGSDLRMFEARFLRYMAELPK